MPAVRGTRAHDVKVAEGGVWVRLRDEAAGGGPPQHGIAEVAAPASTCCNPPAAKESSAGTAEAPAAAGGPLCEDRVREMLKEVKDPELFVNIVDLGLIYGVTLAPSADVPGKQHVAIDMTMTSPACPAGPQLIADTKRAVGASPDVSAVEVRIVMDPPWTPDRMTDAARDQLGIF
jgi:metal-sulfur cluster biosynthetic enzyme